MPRVIIVGGGETGEQLLNLLPNSVVVELDQDRVNMLREKYGEGRIVAGPGADRGVLEKAGAKDAASIIIATGNDTDNFKCARVAREYGPEKVVVRLRSEEHRREFRELGVRTMALSDLFVAGIVGTGMFPKVRSVTEVVVEERSPLAGTPLGELDFQIPVIVGGILRGNHMLSPNDEVILLPGDVLSVITPGDVKVAASDILGASAKKGFSPMKVLGLIDRKASEKRVLDTLLHIHNKVNGETTVATKPGLESSVRRAVGCLKEEGCHIRLEVWEDSRFTPDRVKGARWHGYDLIVATESKGGIMTFWRKSWLEAVMVDSHAPLLNPVRPPPYHKMFFLVDGSKGSRRAADMAMRIAMTHDGELHALVLNEKAARSDYVDLERKGNIYGVEVSKEIIEGNPSLEYVERVRNGGYDLIVMNWMCNTIKKDLLRRVLIDSDTTVLAVP